MLEKWKRKCEPINIAVGEGRLYNLHFGDDQVILVENESDIHYMVWKPVGEYKQWGPNINPPKIEYLVAWNAGKNLLLGDTEIKHRGYYKYLGVKITSNSHSMEETATKVNQGNTAIRQLNGILWDNNISRSTKMMIYKTIIESIGSYDTKLWVINKNDAFKIQATEMN